MGKISAEIGIEKRYELEIGSGGVFVIENVNCSLCQQIIQTLVDVTIEQ